MIKVLKVKIDHKMSPRHFEFGSIKQKLSLIPKVALALVHFTQYARSFQNVLNIFAILKLNNFLRKMDQCERYSSCPIPRLSDEGACTTNRQQLRKSFHLLSWNELFT